MNLVSTPLWKRLSSTKPESYFMTMYKFAKFHSTMKSSITAVAGRRNQNIQPKIYALSLNLFTAYFVCRSTYKVCSQK